LNVSRISGLSPLARGTLGAHVVDYKELRFIPAGAGNTISAPQMWHFGAVYPRWRGEHIRRVNYMAMKRGLSPLARGTLNVGH